MDTLLKRLTAFRLRTISTISSSSTSTSQTLDFRDQVLEIANELEDEVFNDFELGPDYSSLWSMEWRNARFKELSRSWAAHACELDNDWDILCKHIKVYPVSPFTAICGIILNVRHAVHRSIHTEVH